MRKIYMAAGLTAGLVMASAAWVDIWTCDHTGATCWRTDANGVAMALSAVTSAGTTQPLSNLGTVLGSSGPLPVIPPVIVNGGGGFDGVISTSLPPKSCQAGWTLVYAATAHGGTTTAKCAAVGDLRDPE